jgi:hypothetical protein
LKELNGILVLRRELFYLVFGFLNCILSVFDPICNCLFCIVKQIGHMLVPRRDRRQRIRLNVDGIGERRTFVVSRPSSIANPDAAAALKCVLMSAFPWRGCAIF